MAGLADMAGLTTPFGQWAGQSSPLGQNTLEIPQATQQDHTSPQAMAQVLQHYLLTGQGPSQSRMHNHTSHADHIHNRTMPQIGNPADASGLPPYPPSLMNSMQQQMGPGNPAVTNQAIQEFLNRNATPPPPASQQIQKMLQQQPARPSGAVRDPSEIM